MNSSIISQNRALYNITHWSDGFFDINEQGRVVGYPNRQVPGESGIDLVDLVEKTVRETGLCLPILVRFSDILKQRIHALQHAFSQAKREYQYRGEYRGVYPVKVNQQRWVIEEIIRHGGTGLEAGSKPELMAIIGLSAPGSLIVCNGYKDREYVRLALIGQRLGHDVYIILEKVSELDLVLSEARTMGITPKLGIRVRLATVGAGRWERSGGEKSKFGFSASQVLQIVERLRALHQLDRLQVLHFHLGSQVANIADIQRAMHECARHYSELRALGVPIDIVDVGGGLAVDYEGTRSRSYFSMNYSIQEYANNIVYTLEETCRAEKLPHPQIITEAGRATVAHHALLITNVIGIERTLPNMPIKPVGPQESLVLRELWDGYVNISARSALEVYHDACHWMGEVYGMYNHGVVTLAERAWAEQIYLATCFKVRDLLKHSVKAHREALDELNEKLADKYFCNFSLFQSLPDAWAIDQAFPIMPLSGLNEKATCRGVLQDITCDSDGRVDDYIDGEGIETTLPLLPYDPEQPYLLGIFLVGAYQEILGDLHNLFGDTHSVHVELRPGGGYDLTHPVQGDRVSDVLRYVQVSSQELLLAYKKKFDEAQLAESDAETYLNILTESLDGYTYLED